MLDSKYIDVHLLLIPFTLFIPRCVYPLLSGDHYVVPHGCFLYVLFCFCDLPAWFLLCSGPKDEEFVAGRHLLAVLLTFPLGGLLSLCVGEHSEDVEAL